MMQRKLSRRDFLKRTARLAIGTAAAGLASAGYATNVEPAWVDVERVNLVLPRLHEAFNGYRIAQISDIHMSEWMTAERLKEIVALINRKKPDLVAMTGDFTHNNLVPHADGMIAALRELAPPDGVVAVLGNHDHWANERITNSALKQAGAINVSNGRHTLERGSALLHIAGVDDVWERKARLDRVLYKMPKEGAAILLAHEPDFADTSAATGRFDLQISGHSHGGQVIIPFLGPPRLPYLGTKYPMGLYRVGEMLQYTNRGVGMVRPFVRINCRPEITVFKLESMQQRRG